MSRHQCIRWAAAVIASSSLGMVAAPAARGQDSAAGAAKSVSFAVSENYGKGADLAQVARDFDLMRELDVDTLRCGWGWDDLEPERGQYDLAWLKQFVELAAQKGIRLRPYIGSTPAWAGTPDRDGQPWNNPPAKMEDWQAFVTHLAQFAAAYPTVLSLEVYNEPDLQEWWEGDAQQYRDTLQTAAQAIRAASPRLQVHPGSLFQPNADWLRPVLADGAAPYEVLPFHAYPESWGEPEVESYLNGPFRAGFVPLAQSAGAKPIWVNAMGCPTYEDVSEKAQAAWWARAVATFLADPAVEHIGIRELRDNPPNTPDPGGEAANWLGLVRADGTKKMAFQTVDMLTDLLDKGRLRVTPGQFQVKVTNGKAKSLNQHLFRRPDGKQVLFLWDRQGKLSVKVTLEKSGSGARRYQLDGTASPFALSDKGRVIPRIDLEPGEVQIFLIDP